VVGAEVVAAFRDGQPLRGCVLRGPVSGNARDRIVDETRAGRGSGRRAASPAAGRFRGQVQLVYWLADAT
jgi:hypothetical protein